MQRPERINEIISMIEEADPEKEGVVSELIDHVLWLEQIIEEYIGGTVRRHRPLTRAVHGLGIRRFRESSGTCSTKEHQESFNRSFQEECDEAIEKLSEINKRKNEMGSAESIRLREAQAKHNEKFRHEYFGEFKAIEEKLYDNINSEEKYAAGVNSRRQGKSYLDDTVKYLHAEHEENLYNNLNKGTAWSSVPSNGWNVQEDDIEENKKLTSWSVSNGWLAEHDGDMELTPVPTTINEMTISPASSVLDTYKRAFESGYSFSYQGGELVQVNEIGMSYCNHRGCPITTVQFSNGEEIIFEEK